MPLPPKSNHMVTLAEASVLTRNYRTNAADPSIKGGMLWKEAIERVIDQPGCVALRYYYGMKDSGAPTLVFVGVDHEGQDIVHGVVADLVWVCPPFCSEPNLLNSPVEHGKWSAERVASLSLAE